MRNGGEEQCEIFCRERTLCRSAGRDEITKSTIDIVVTSDPHIVKRHENTKRCAAR